LKILAVLSLRDPDNHLLTTNTAQAMTHGIAVIICSIIQANNFSNEIWHGGDIEQGKVGDDDAGKKPCD
jgi:hypothetical protein